MFDEKTQSAVVNNSRLQIDDLTEVEELANELTDDELDLVGGGRMWDIPPGERVPTLADGFIRDTIVF